MIGQLILAKRSSGRREVYLKSLDHYLHRFAKDRDGLAIEDITTAQVEEFLVKCINGNTRATWLNRISTLFSFAVKRGFISKNPCDNVERSRIDRKAPSILSPDQAVQLLGLCPSLCRPYLILGLYAGIRPDELYHIDWKDVNFETSTVCVNHTKTRRRRIVPLEPIAVKLLSEHPVKTGPVAPSLSTVRRFKRMATGICGGAWQADLLRHTAASYLLALHGDAGKVSLTLGNSSKILLTHYHTPVSQADCKAFWAV